MGKIDFAELLVSLVLSYLLYEFVVYLHELGGGSEYDFLTSFGHITIYATCFWLCCFLSIGITWASKNLMLAFFRRIILGFVFVSFCSYYYNQAENKYWTHLNSKYQHAKARCQSWVNNKDWLFFDPWNDNRHDQAFNWCFKDELKITGHTKLSNANFYGIIPTKTIKSNKHIYDAKIKFLKERRN
jgi:hypothetical protein